MNWTHQWLKLDSPSGQLLSWSLFAGKRFLINTLQVSVTLSFHDHILRKTKRINTKYIELGSLREHVSASVSTTLQKLLLGPEQNKYSFVFSGHDLFVQLFTVTLVFCLFVTAPYTSYTAKIKLTYALSMHNACANNPNIT